MLGVESFFSKELAPCVVENSRAIEIASDDLSVLQQIAHSQTWPWFQVRRARILLGIADGCRTQTLAFQTQCDESTVRRTCRRYERLGLSGLLELAPRSGRPIAISPCNVLRSLNWPAWKPVAEGLHITHWTSKDLARQIVADSIVPSISARTVRRILHDVDLQPHRTCYWRTAHLDLKFKQRAEKVLWCYANALARLAKLGYWVVYADEMPNHQVLERHFRSAVRSLARSNSKSSSTRGMGQSTS